MRRIAYHLARFVDWLLLGPHAGENPKSWRYDCAFGFAVWIGKLTGYREESTR